ncbi:unnamed protein product [Protopolystoma xenopodis]|uniref:Uncharacterized protein n=1 Tax=Protopolystoma xenopodis TaxID=117903 RepID=A0A448WBC8_9PLAT|nr:unnamed protein product [Protopolystoma xenopodis]
MTLKICFYFSYHASDHTCLSDSASSSIDEVRLSRTLLPKPRYRPYPAEETEIAASVGEHSLLHPRGTFEARGRPRALCRPMASTSDPEGSSESISSALRMLVHHQHRQKNRPPDYSHQMWSQEAASNPLQAFSREAQVDWPQSTQRVGREASHIKASPQSEHM